MAPESPESNFPYTIVYIIAIWALLGVSYLIARWRQRPKATYVIPRVFVLCSPRTVQFHYELILRVGLPSADYNPDKHDIDLTVQGQQRNEVVPMTRLNTKTLLDEPLITSLSIIVYRLVEMPTLGSLVLRHSGPFKAWLYVYDFTVIDLANNREQYFAINKYAGSLNRLYLLDEFNDTGNVHYPIDDVPLPQWSTEDMFLLIYCVTNCIMLTMSVAPISCGTYFLTDLGSIVLASIHGGAVVFFLEWLLYYYARWNQDRREYFNLGDGKTCSLDNLARIVTAATATLIGALAIFFSLEYYHLEESLIWLLCVTNTSIIVIGTWNLARQAEVGEGLLSWSLRFQGVESLSVGMKYSEIVSDIQTKSGSTSDDGNGSTLSSVASRLTRSFGPRSSIKSFGFDPATGAPSRRPPVSRLVATRLLSTTNGPSPSDHQVPHSKIVTKH